jgi:hypothetical protein
MPNILFVTIFFCPTLVDVGLVPLASNHDLNSPLPGTVSDVLRNLEDKKPLLRQLSLPWPYHTQSIPPGLEESLLASLRQYIHLVEVQVTPSVSILQGLARLPFLRSLTLCSMMEEDEPDARYPENQSQEGDSLFAALEDLFITEALSLPALTRLLHGSHCFPKSRVAIRCRDICTEWQLATFLQVVIHPLRSKELLRFDLRMEGEWDANKHWEYGIALDTLRPLLSLRHLENFGIDPGLSLHLNDSDLKEMVSAWPGLTHLDLGTAFPSLEALPNFEPPITLQGLQSLTVLPELVQLSLTLAPQSGDLVSLLSPSTRSSSPLTGVMLRPGVMEFSAVEMALFLVQRFPKLSTVKWLSEGEVGYDAYCAQKWEEVGEGLAGARRALYGTSKSDKSVATSE